MNELPTLIWFFLPAGIANMAPVLVARLPVLNRPIDAGRKFRGRAILGPHKTWRGLVFGVAAACILVYFQMLCYPRPNGQTLVNYESVNILWLGFLLGLGALGGDILKSFFKRRLNIPSGRPWVPFDQIDWILGAAILSQFVVRLSLGELLTAVIFFGLLHPIVNLVGYFIGLKPNKF